MICHYPGNCADFIVGQVMGPDTAEGWALATGAVFDGTRTTVSFRPLTLEQRALAVIDQWGALRLPATAETAA